MSRLFLKFIFTTAFIAVIIGGTPEANAAVSVISGGAINGSVTNGNNVTLTFPVGVQQGDVVIVYGGHPFRSGAPLGPLTAGYTVIASHTAAAPSFGAWYKVMGASPDANVVGRGTGNTADATAYGAYILRGVDPSIFDQTAVTVGPTTSTNPNPGSIITQTSGAWVLALAGSQVIDASPGTPTNYTNLNTKSGNDSNDITIAGVTREIASPASEDPPAYPTWSSGAWYAITIALKPEPPSSNTVTVGAALTQPTNVTEGATGVVMGAFTFISSASTATVDSIKISETGTVNANANLANVKLYAQQESVCSFAGSSQIGTTQSFTATDDATFNTLGLSVGTVTQQCVFVVLDVGASAGNGNSIEIEISASGDVGVTGGSVAGTFPVQIAGSTNIRNDSGTIMSSEIDFDWVPAQPSWGEALFATTETEGDVKLRVYYTVSASCDTIVPDSALAGNSTGFDALASPLNISGLNTVTYNRLCLQATLTAGASVSPTLNSWAVTWVPPGGVGTFEQSAYRFFQNENGTNVVTALVPQNTPATLTSANQAFRLRLLIHRGTSALIQNGQSFKLQYAVKSATCGAYSDVTLVTPVAFNDNAIPADGSALTANGSLDPTHASDVIVPETYEEANNFTNSVAAIPAGQDGMWDFSLRTNSAPSGTMYCFRVVRSDNSVLDTYTVTPEIISATLYVISGTYESNAFDTGAVRSFHVISWTTSKTNAACGACVIRVQIKTSPDGVIWSPTWAGFEGELDGDETDYYTVSTGELIHMDHNGDRWIKYRATLDGDTTASPVLEEIKINYRN